MTPAAKTVSAGPRTKQTDTADVILDRDGLWTTVPGPGAGSMRSLPVAGGMAPARVWSLPADATLGPWLADHLQGAPTARTLAIGHLVATAIRAAEQGCVPVPADEGWRWRLAPGPYETDALQRAVSVCLAAGVVLDDEPESRLRTLVDDVVNSRLAATPPNPDVFAGMSANRKAAHLWADHVIARSGANARTVLVLSPPDAESQPDFPESWTLALLAVRLDEPTTRLPWQTADPALFHATTTAWNQWAITEMLMLQRAWGTSLSDVVQALQAGPVAELADTDVLEFLDRVAPRLQAAGFDVIAPGGLLRAAPVRRRLAQSGSGTAVMRIDDLGLDAEVLVDGVPLSSADFATLAASKSELVSVRGRWLRIGPGDVQRLASLARRLNRPVTPEDLLADEAFDGVDLDADQVITQGLRPARTTALPDSVHATLRPYQRAGLDWLTWLADNRIGGILADDMGLGKTLQVLTWIAADHHGPTLVVCPVTLVDTWARQAEQFTPGLRVHSFHGGSRGDVTMAAADADIVVTTYGLLARDESLAQISVAPRRA